MDVDDAFEAVVEFESGAIGTVAASRLALGRKNACAWEINGSKGSLAFDLERLNELQVTCADSASAHGVPHGARLARPTTRSGSTGGRTGTSSAGSTRSCTSSHHLLRRSPDDGDVAPYGATFEDGYRAAEICDAIVRSSESGAREQVEYR